MHYNFGGGGGGDDARGGVEAASPDGVRERSTKKQKKIDMTLWFFLVLDNV